MGVPFGRPHPPNRSWFLLHAHRSRLSSSGPDTSDAFSYQAAQRHGRVAFATSRTPDAHLPFVPPERRVLYDLLRPETWRHVPTRADVVWCFPALPEDEATRFAQRVSDRGNRLVVLGSTAAFPSGRSNVIDEQTPIDHSIPRVAAEERLRTTFGAVILRLAGIYGPGPTRV